MSLFLSRLSLNPRSQQVISEMRHPYEMHRTLSKAFPPDTFRKERKDNDAAGVLFRVDGQPCTNSVIILVQSRIAPDWAYLDAVKDAWRHAYLLRAPESRPFVLKLAVGQDLAFRLRANPTKRLGKSAGGDKGKRVGIYKEDEQLKWLEEKLHGNQERGRAPSGFRLLSAQSRDEKIEDKPEFNNARPELELLSVQFDGILKVENVDLACQTIESGIGPAKGFGFGLLSIAPLRS